MSDLFKWKHFNREIILLSVRWYCSYGLSYRDLAEMMSERGVDVAHTTIMRWVHQYAPEIMKKLRPHLKPTNDSWRVDETYIKVKGKWVYLYRSVDKSGQTLDYLLRAKRDAKAAFAFFKKTLQANHTETPRVINVDNNPAFPCAFNQLIENGLIPTKTILRQVKYLNNIVEQDHRFIKTITGPALGYQSCRTATRTISGIEAMHMIRKEQVDDDFPEGLSRAQIIEKLFLEAAC